MTLRPLVLLATLLTAGAALEACTNLLITKGASKDGSTMITYAADSHTLYGELYFKPGAKHSPSEVRVIREWDSGFTFDTGKVLGSIPEAPVTYTRVGNMNENQVTIAETGPGLTLMPLSDGNVASTITWKTLVVGSCAPVRSWAAEIQTLFVASVPAPNGSWASSSRRT